MTSDIAHLLRRAGFGSTPNEIAVAAESGLSATIDSLINFDGDSAAPAPAATVLDARVYRSDVLGQWWIQLMLTSQHPLQEKMTLFWHGHFATAIGKVGSEVMMYNQNQLFRSMALGRFDDLLSAVYKDPAMLKWLDGDLNARQAPNENWGREVMELFTLGHGNYTEDDVHACSRAFTGWRIGTDGKAVFVPRLHDDGVKTLLGHTGPWNGEDAVRILAAHPAAGPFLATKLWRFFAADAPSQSAIRKLAAVYYSSDHNIGAMVQTLFGLSEFYAPATRNGHVKSPVEFVVGTLRLLGLQGTDLTSTPFVLAALGQELFNPPNVGGWPGGPSWINAATFLARFNFASSITGDLAPARGLVDLGSLLAASNAERVGQLVGYVAKLLGIDLTARTAAALQSFAGAARVDETDVYAKLRGLLHLALISPEYQVL